MVSSSELALQGIPAMIIFNIRMLTLFPNQPLSDSTKLAEVVKGKLKMLELFNSNTTENPFSLNYHTDFLRATHCLSGKYSDELAQTVYSSVFWIV